jgi:hypothetical protein
MLKVEHEGETMTVVSDDANAENAALSEAIDLAAPHLLKSYDEAPYDNGELRWKVGAEDWQSLIEALAALEGGETILDPTEVDEAIEVVEVALKQRG